MSIGQRKSVLLCGPSRKAVSGVSTHLNQLFNSKIASSYSLHQFQVGSEGRNEGSLQKILRYITSPILLLVCIIRLRPDIVHLNTSLDMKAYWRDLVYMLISRALGCRIVYQVHGGKLPAEFFGSSKVGHFFLRWSLGIPDVLVLLAVIERNAYLKFDAGRRVMVIPNAIDLDEYREIDAKSFDNAEIVLGYIGRLAVDKGIKEAIIALAGLRQRGLNFLSLRIAGSGSYENELRKLVEQEKLEDSVQFLGPIFGMEKIRFWREIDIYVFPTYREGLPYTVLEALASGTPVITTRVGGIPDVIQEGIHGVFVEQQNPKQLADAIEGLVGQRALLRDMSAAAIQRAHDQYGVTRLAEQFDHLYQELLS